MRAYSSSRATTRVRPLKPPVSMTREPGGSEQRAGLRFERVAERHERERGSRDAHRCSRRDRARDPGQKACDVRSSPCRHQARAVAALARDRRHHVAQRGVRVPLGIGHEAQVAQPRAVGEQQAVETREQRSFVQARRARR